MPWSTGTVGTAAGLPGAIEAQIQKLRLSKEARAHLEDSMSTLEDALKAPMVRTS